MAERRGRGNGSSQEPGWEEKKRQWAATREAGSSGSASQPAHKKARTGGRLRHVAQRAERRGREILDRTRAQVREPSPAAHLGRQAAAVARGAARLGLTAALMPLVAWRMWRRRAAS